MAYIGVQPRLGNFQACDAISTSATDTFNLLVGGVAIFPQTAQHCLVSLNGVLQAPISSYNISGSTIVFASALTSADSIDFITILGDTLDLGTPSDSTVTTAKVVDGAITSAKLASGVGGKVLQVLYTKTDSAQTISSGSYTDLTSMSLAITPSSSSNKILIRAGISGELTANDHGFGIGIVRGSTAVLTENTKALYGNGITELVARLPFEFLDSPSTTSATTYKIQVKTHDGNSVIFNRSSVSFLVLMEVAA